MLLHRIQSDQSNQWYVIFRITHLSCNIPSLRLIQKDLGFYVPSSRGLADITLQAALTFALMQKSPKNQVVAKAIMDLEYSATLNH